MIERIGEADLVLSCERKELMGRTIARSPPPLDHFRATFIEPSEPLINARVMFDKAELSQGLLQRKERMDTHRPPAEAVLLQRPVNPFAFRAQQISQEGCDGELELRFVFGTPLASA